MTKHFEGEIEKLKKRILHFSALVEESVQKSVTALETRDPQLAQRVVDSDPDIDAMEVETEEECLKILALYQPVAFDLRFIVAVLKINNDLERIGDLAVNIAESAAVVSDRPRVDIGFDFSAMAAKAKEMLRGSLDSLVQEDADLARRVRAADDVVDDMHRRMYQRVAEALRRDPDQAETLQRLTSISRQLERIADHATNIAEDVIYMLKGEIVRHGRSSA